PLSQWALRFYGNLAYHDYEGVSLDLDERERLQRDIGQHQVLVLRNHGLLTVGRNVAEAFSLTYYFEQAARAQLQMQEAAAEGGERAARSWSGACARLEPSGGQVRRLRSGAR